MHFYVVGYIVITICFIFIMRLRSSLYKEKIRMSEEAFYWRTSYFIQQDENMKYRERIRAIAEWAENLPDDIQEDMLDTISPGSIQEVLLDINN